MCSDVALTVAAAERLPKKHPLHPSTEPTQFLNNYQLRLLHGSHGSMCLAAYGHRAIEGNRYLSSDDTDTWRDSDYSLTSDSKYFHQITLEY